MSAAALSVGLAVGSQTKFFVKASGPLTQSGYTILAVARALSSDSSAESATIRSGRLIITNQSCVSLLPAIQQVIVTKTASDM